MLRLALAQIRTRPASFVALAATALLAVTTITMFSSLIAADVATPKHLKPPASSDEMSLGIVAGVFGEGAILVSLFVMLNCIGFAVRHQLRDLALLRTVAATPRQIHRLVRWEALVIVAAVAPLGWILGSAGAGWFLHALQGRGFAAPAIEIPATPLPMLLAVVATGLIAVAACAVGVRRVTRMSPATALSDSASEPRRVGWFRTLLGVLALADAAALIGVNLAAGGEDAVQGAFLALLMLMVTIGLLGPLLAGLAAWLLGAGPRRWWPRIGWMADANLRGHVRRLSAAVIPLALLVGLACNFLFVGPTMDRVATPDPGSELAGFADADENWLRLVELGMFTLLAAVAVVNTLVAVTAERRDEFRLLALMGATRRDLGRMLVTEAVLVVLIGLGLGTLAGAVTLATFSQGATGSWVPSVPMASYAAIVAATAALAAPSILITGRRTLSRSDRAVGPEPRGVAHASPAS